MIGAWSLAVAALAVGTTPAPQDELGNTCSKEIVGEGITNRCTWYDLYPSMETEQDKCVAQHRGHGFGEVSKCLCYLPMVQCTGNTRRTVKRCSNAETYCRATMEKAGCNPDWCDQSQPGGEVSEVVKFRTTASSLARMNKGVFEYMPAGSVNALRKWGRLSATDVARLGSAAAGRVDYITDVELTIRGAQNGVPKDLGRVVVRALEDLVHNAGFRQLTWTTNCIGCTARVTKNCFSFLARADPRDVPAFKDDKCEDYTKYPEPAEIDDSYYLNTCPADLAAKGFADASKCICYIGFTQCVAESGCAEGRAYCEKVMTHAGCNPAWCSVTDPDAVDHFPQQGPLYTLEGANNGLLVPNAVLDQFEGLADFRMVGFRQKNGAAHGINGNYMDIGMVIPFGTIGVGNDVIDVLRSNLRDYVKLPAFRATAKVDGWTTFGEKNCYNFVWEAGNPLIPSTVANGDMCTDYMTYPRGRTEPTKQRMCSDLTFDRGFSQATSCLCYLEMAECVSGTTCAPGQAYCRKVMTDAGCNPHWCGTAAVGGDRDVSLTYTIGDGDAADVAQRIKSYAMLMMTHNALESSWVSVKVAEESPRTVGSRTATVTVSIPASAKYPEEVDAYVVTQLQDLPRNATFTGNTFVLGVVDGSASLPGATPSPSWTTPEPTTAVPLPPTQVPTSAQPTTAQPATAHPATAGPTTSEPMSTSVPGSIATIAPATPPADEDSSNTGLIAGLVVGGIVVVAAGGALVWYCTRRVPINAPEVEMTPTPHNASPENAAPTFAGSPPLPVRNPNNHHGRDYVA